MPFDCLCGGDSEYVALRQPVNIGPHRLVFVEGGEEPELLTYAIIGRASFRVVERHCTILTEPIDIGTA